MKIIAIYARVSIERDESKSIETQIELCKKEFVNEGDKVKTYEDNGYSGKNIDRPALKDLIYDIEKGIISKVVIYKIDRLSRRFIDFVNLHEIMEEHNCALASVNDNFDTSTKTGKTMMQMLAIFAEMERDNITARITDTYNYRLKTGGWAVGMAPYGYRNFSRPDKSKTLEPIPEEIKAIKYMFKKYAEDTNTSLNQIHNYLIENNYSGHRQTNGGFSRSTINRILRNPIYATADEVLYEYYKSKGLIFINDKSEWNGKVASSIVGKNGKQDGVDLKGLKIYLTDVKPIIDSRTFVTVQNRLSKNSAYSRDNSPKTQLKELAGLIKCSKCGYAVKMRKYPTLTCSGRSIIKVCDVSFRGIKLENIQKQVDKEIDNYLSNLDKTLDEKRKEHKDIKKEIAKLEGKLEKLIDLEASSSGPATEIVKKKINDTSTTISELYLKLQTDAVDDVIALRLGLHRHSDFVSLFDDKGNLIVDYSSMDTEKKQMILRILVKQINLKNDGSIDIIYNS